MEGLGFYDPLGVFFDKNGFDADGGRYDDNGFYVAAAHTYPIRQVKYVGEYQKPELRSVIE